MKQALDMSMNSVQHDNKNSTVGKNSASLNNSAIVLNESFQSTGGASGKIFVASKPGSSYLNQAMVGPVSTNPNLYVGPAVAANGAYQQKSVL